MSDIGGMPILDNPFLGIFFGSQNQSTATAIGGSNQPMRIMHAPSHINKDLVKSLKSIERINPVAFGRTEMHIGDSIAVMRRELGGKYRICIDSNPHPNSQENPIGLRRQNDIHFQSSKLFQLSENIPGKGWGNDRWLNIVKFTYYGDPYFYMATHWNAVLQHRPLGQLIDGPRTTAMIRAYQIIKREGELLLKEGRQGYLSGDFNYFHPHAGVPLWKYSPQNLFMDLNMKFHEEGVDYLGWTAGLHQTSPIRVIRKGTQIDPSDHPWIVGHFARKERKK